MLSSILGPLVGRAVQFVAVIILHTWAARYNLWECHYYYPRLLQILEHLAIQFTHCRWRLSRA